MIVYLWIGHSHEYFWSLVLFDGENTYWTDEMRPSGGYTKWKMRSDFRKIGEL